MIIPFGFGRGHAGRQLIKLSTSNLEKELLLEPRNGCAYECMGLGVYKWMINLILKHRDKRYVKHS